MCRAHRIHVDYRRRRRLCRACQQLRAARHRRERRSRPFVDGECSSRLGVQRSDCGVLFPYDDDTSSYGSTDCRELHRYAVAVPNAALAKRATISATAQCLSEGVTWCEWHRFDVDKLERRCRSPLPSSPRTTTSCSTAVARCSSRPRRSSSCVRDATEDDHLALLGLLNSSTACFWMKQVVSQQRRTVASVEALDSERCRGSDFY